MGSLYLVNPRKNRRNLRPENPERDSWPEAFIEGVYSNLLTFRKISGKLTINSNPNGKMKMVLPATKVLVFDTETTGLPKKGDILSPEQPWPIQIGAVLMDLASDTFEWSMSTIVVPPEGVYFEPKAVAVHGLSEELVRDTGRDMIEVFQELRDIRKKAHIVAAYNLPFDERIVRSSSQRLHPDFENDLVLGTPEEVFHHCIMQHSIGYFKGRQKLGQVYKRLTGKFMEDAHDALADTLAAAEVFKELIVRTCGEPE